MEQKAKEAASHAAIPVSISAMLVTLGVVYGDIGTSPMYVTKALVAGNGGIGSVTEELCAGCVLLGMAHHPRHAGRRGTARRWHPHARRYRDYGYRGPAHHSGSPCCVGRRSGPRRGHHTCHHHCALLGAAHRHGQDRPCLWPHHDAVVSVPGRYGSVLCLPAPRGAAVPQPAARHRLFVEPQQPCRHHDSGQLLPCHHRCRGALFRHGPRGPRQHLRNLAVR